MADVNEIIAALAPDRREKLVGLYPQEPGWWNLAGPKDDALADLLEQGLIEPGPQDLGRFHEQYWRLTPLGEWVAPACVQAVKAAKAHAR